MSETFDINDTGRIPVGIAKLDLQSELPAADVPEIIIITGMSGAGRTRAGATLEDLDWYVIDNLPPSLLPAMARLVTAQSGVKKLACVVDVRTREFFQELMGVLKELDDSNTNYRILFLDASNEELVRRYESVRRPHPLQGKGRLLDGIVHERNVIEGLRLRSDVVIDTTTLSVHDLARKVRELVSSEQEARVHLTVMSFGFKYGLPVDADHVVDVRFLPNPYWVTELRHLTGKDEPVRDFVLSIDGAQSFADKYVDLLADIVHGYERELKPYVTIAVGCTGGKHRSVAMAEEISAQFSARGLPVRTLHRDLGRE
ncbi:RNase adapter RapZ [Arcanobacterium bovis]|uniref:RNase adapter RapZ n=1 Tax=Arcanobacterium bovis TaxID=2529275 RepID=A0A4Q9V1G2_9ACTO|nr:RNase adapter RapZ [Arcanobacterium bovis]TBW22950.1 RNase adapter RapZ [Arcanobacterium bovis]